jgi:predicted acyl esterase
MTRWDWGQDLFEWFEYYLKGVGEKPQLHAQIQRNDGEWRIEPTWPPLDAQSIEQPLSDCVQTGQRVGGASVVGGGFSGVMFECPTLFEQTDTLLSGLFTLHLEVTAAMDGGQVFVEMQDVETNLRLGHATMDIRYHQGGSEPTTVLPGQSLTMLMEFQAIDALLPAGHGLRLILTETGEDYLAPACGALCPVTVNGGILTLDYLLRDGSNVLITPQGENAANN